MEEWIWDMEDCCIICDFKKPMHDNWCHLAALVEAARIAEEAARMIIWLRDYASGFESFMSVHGWKADAEVLAKAKEIDVLLASLSRATEDGLNDG